METGSDASKEKGDAESSNAATGAASRNSPKAQEDSWWGSWSQGWIDKVKEKSASTLEMVKKDLNEFVEVIQGDTSVAMSETAEKLDDHVKNNENQSEDKKNLIGNLNTTELVTQGVKGFSQVLHSMSELMAVQEPDDSNEEFITLSEGSFSLQSYNRKQEKLQILQTDPGTYCNEPEGSFNDWMEVFSLDEHKEDMSDLLTQNPAVRAVYSRLVPSVISHTTFWQRYYYKVFLLESEERKREELLARADKGANDDNTEDEDGGWGDDDDDDIEVIKPSVIATLQLGSVDKTPVKAYKNDDNVINTISDVAISMTSPPLQSMRSDDIDTKMTAKIDEQEQEQNEIPETQADVNVLEKSYETMKDDTEFSKGIEPIESNKPVHKPEENDSRKTLLPDSQSDKDFNKPESSETGSIGSWVSIDDDIKVKKIKGEQVVKGETRPLSDGSSSNSSGVLINKSEADDLDDDDFDIDLDDVDDDEEELAKMVQEIKNKSAAGDLQDDDDWENWE